MHAFSKKIQQISVLRVMWYTNLNHLQTQDASIPAGIKRPMTQTMLQVLQFNQLIRGR